MTIKKPMTTEDASRIQSREAKNHNGKVGKNSFTTRAQRAAKRNKDTK